MKILRNHNIAKYFVIFLLLRVQNIFGTSVPFWYLSDNNVEWRAGFVLVPKDRISFGKILVLNLPQESISSGSVSDHSRYSAKLFAALNQLIDYYEAIANEKTRTLFQQQCKIKLNSHISNCCLDEEIRSKSTRISRTATQKQYRDQGLGYFARGYEAKVPLTTNAYWTSMFADVKLLVGHYTRQVAICFLIAPIWLGKYRLLLLMSVSQNALRSWTWVFCQIPEFFSIYF